MAPDTHLEVRRMLTGEEQDRYLSRVISALHAFTPPSIPLEIKDDLPRIITFFELLRHTPDSGWFSKIEQRLDNSGFPMISLYLQVAQDTFHRQRKLNELHLIVLNKKKHPMDHVSPDEVQDISSEALHRLLRDRLVDKLYRGEHDFAEDLLWLRRSLYLERLETADPFGTNITLEGECEKTSEWTSRERGALGGNITLSGFDLITNLFARYQITLLAKNQRSRKCVDPQEKGRTLLDEAFGMPGDVLWALFTKARHYEPEQITLTYLGPYHDAHTTGDLPSAVYEALRREDSFLLQATQHSLLWDADVTPFTAPVWKRKVDIPVRYHEQKHFLVCPPDIVEEVSKAVAEQPDWSVYPIP